MNTAKKSCNKDKKTGCLINAPYLETLTTLSKKDMPKAIRDWLMSLQPDSRASHSRSQEKDKPKMTQEICGRKQSKSLKSSSQNALFLKTSPDCYLQNQVWMKSQADLFHTALPFSGTWMKQGIMQDGQCWALEMSEHHIKESGCGYWPTPNVCGNYNRKGASKTSGDGLATKVKDSKLWRTPHASDGEGGIMEMRDGISGHYKLRDHVQEKNKGFWPTPTTPRPHDSNNTAGKYYQSQNQKDLTWAVIKKFPTPRASMMTEADMEQAKFAGNSPNRPKYCDAGKGSLNPDWVEYLMGWPIFWTSLEPITELLWLDWNVDPADNGSIPRVATKIKDRVNRLKAIGNGQVSLCVATAWRILINYV